MADTTATLPDDPTTEPQPFVLPEPDLTQGQLEVLGYLETFQQRVLDMQAQLFELPPFPDIGGLKDAATKARLALANLQSVVTTTQDATRRGNYPANLPIVLLSPHGEPVVPGEPVEPAPTEPPPQPTATTTPPPENEFAL